jgi:hypothetical protein
MSKKVDSHQVFVNKLVESINRLAATDPKGPAVVKRVAEVQDSVSCMDSAVSAEKCSGGCHCQNNPVPAPVPVLAPGESFDATAPVLVPGESFDTENLLGNSEIVNQIDAMRSMAATPASNYGRILSILDGLRHASVLASRPQNASIRPRLAQIVNKVAGIFKEIDTVEDLNQPLEQIERAVHSLYGNQSANSTFYFDRRGKGHRSE